MTPHKTDIKQQKMGDKYVSNALMMSTKNNLYERIPYFLYRYLMKATIPVAVDIVPVIHI